MGWAVDDHMRTELVTLAVQWAVFVRGSRAAGVILHSDRGSQYTAHDLALAAAMYGLRRSMGATGICWDKGLASKCTSWHGFGCEFVSEGWLGKRHQSRTVRSTGRAPGVVPRTGVLRTP
jgi:putative transposase